MKRKGDRAIHSLGCRAGRVGPSVVPMKVIDLLLGFGLAASTKLATGVLEYLFWSRREGTKGRSGRSGEASDTHRRRRTIAEFVPQ